MLRGFKTVAVFIIVMAFVGAVVGVLLGALADNYLLWVAVMAVVWIAVIVVAVIGLFWALRVLF